MRHIYPNKLFMSLKHFDLLLYLFKLVPGARQMEISSVSEETHYYAVDIDEKPEKSKLKRGKYFVT